MADTAEAPAPTEPPVSTNDRNGEKAETEPAVNGEKEDAKPSDMEVEATDTAKRSADAVTSSEKADDEGLVTPSKKRPKILDMELVDDDEEEDFKPKKGQFCDVCFLPQDTGFTNLGKCKGCDLVVHSSCYEKKYLDDTGHFKCDVCVAVKKGKLPKACMTATPKKGKKPRKIEDVVTSPGPLPPKIEATCDGREYPEPDVTGNEGSSIDVFCQICLRRDVMGGMKPTDEGKWVHLACTMATTDTWFDGSVVRGVTNCIKKNMKDRMKKNDGVEPSCEACGLSGGFLVQCAYIEPKKSKAKTSPKKKSPKKKKAPPPKPPTVYRGERKTCRTWLHPLCAEICERVRIIQKTDNGDVIHYKCAEHSYLGLDTCGICKRGSRQNEMIECDGCQRGYHMSCLTPPLEEVPEGEWKCNKCLGIPDPEEKKEEPETKPEPKPEPEPEKSAEKEEASSEWISDGLTKPDTETKGETAEAVEKEEKADDEGAEKGEKPDDKDAKKEVKEDEAKAEDKTEEAPESKETPTEPVAEENKKGDAAEEEKKGEVTPPEAKDDSPAAEEKPKGGGEESKESTEAKQ